MKPNPDKTSEDPSQICCRCLNVYCDPEFCNCGSQSPNPEFRNPVSVSESCNYVSDDSESNHPKPCDMLRREQLQDSSTSDEEVESSPPNNSVPNQSIPSNHPYALFNPFNGQMSHPYGGLMNHPYGGLMNHPYGGLMNHPFGGSMNRFPYGSIYPPFVNPSLLGYPMCKPNPQQFLNFVADKRYGMSNRPYFVYPHLAPFPPGSMHATVRTSEPAVINPASQQSEVTTRTPTIQQTTNEEENERDLNESEDGLCEICEAPSSGIHFGVKSCDDCKNFFKYSIENRMVYKCKKDKNCNIRKSRK